MAEELGITDDDLELLEWETPENSSDDGLFYDYVLKFYETCEPVILEKIDGLDENRTIRVSVSAFDDPYPR